MSKQYILVVKQKKVNGKTFPQYALRDLENENLWLSANLTKEASAKITLDKPLFPVAIELNDDNYFIGSYKAENNVTGEVIKIPKVVIKDYVKVEHIECCKDIINSLLL